jgi:hypothetical protein
MACHAYLAEYSGKTWVLHVFDVEGEEDEVAMTLEVKSSGAFAGLQDEFSGILRGMASEHPGAALCTECRAGNESWTVDFNDWVLAAYAKMREPPVPVSFRDVPAVVRHIFEASVLGPSTDRSSVS